MVNRDQEPAPNTVRSDVLDQITPTSHAQNPTFVAILNASQRLFRKGLGSMGNFEDPNPNSTNANIGGGPPMAP